MQNKHRGSSNVVLVVVLTILVLLVSYILVVKKDTKPSLPLPVENTYQTPNLPDSGGISNWKTYTNAEYGFQFKYPSDLVFEEVKGIDGEGVNYFHVNIDTKSNMDFTCEACDGPGMFFQVRYHKSKVNPIYNCLPPEGQISKVKVGGIIGDKCIADGMNGPSLNIYLTKDGANYHVIGADYYSGERIPLIDKIVSTFKFTKSSDIILTFPREGSVLQEGQTYNITWSISKDEPKDKGISYWLGFNWGCTKDGEENCGYVRISDIDIHSKSFAWTIPNLKDYLCCGDSDPKISPEDKYKITIYALWADNYSGKYSSPDFKIISK